MNKVVLIGRLTSEPVVRYTQSNKAVVSFTLAVSRRFTSPNGEKETDFINIVAFGTTGEFCSKYFTKGLQVGVVGRLQIRNWESEDGKKHNVAEVIAEEVYFADSKKDNIEDAVEDITYGIDEEDRPF